MEKKILYTSSYEDIIESVANICGCKKELIKNYLQRSRPYKNTCASEVVITDFFKAIGVQFIGNNQLFAIIKFDACIVSHLTTRISPPDSSDLYCLIQALTEETDINIFLASKDIIFKKTSQGLDVYYNGEKVNWDSIDNTVKYRIIKRLRIKGKYIDNCINGFLFNHIIWEDCNVEHIKDCPEIVRDICEALNRYDIVQEWRNIAKPYALGLLVNTKDIIFDSFARYRTTRCLYTLYTST